MVQLGFYCFLWSSFNYGYKVRFIDVRVFSLVLVFYMCWFWDFFLFRCSFEVWGVGQVCWDLWGGMSVLWEGMVWCGEGECRYIGFCESFKVMVSVGF